MSEHEKIEILIAEKNRIDNAKLEMQKLFVNVIFLFVTFLGTTAGILSSDEIFEKPDSKRVIMFILSQVEFFLGLLVLSIGCYIILQGAYIAALETKVNKRIGEKILVWQSKIHRRFVVKPTGVFFWITAVLLVTILTVYIYFIKQTLSSNSNPAVLPPFIMGVVVTGEGLLSLILVGFTYREKRRAEDYANRILCTDSEKQNRTTDY